MATHFSILAWKIPWTGESGELQSMGSQRVGHDWVTDHMYVHTCTHTHTHTHTCIYTSPKQRLSCEPSAVNSSKIGESETRYRWEKSKQKDMHIFVLLCLQNVYLENFYKFFSKFTLWVYKITALIL